LVIFPVYAKQLPKAVVAVARPDFTGRWKIASPELTVKPQDYDVAILTNEAKRRLSAYTSNYNSETESPELFSMPHGMP
jgi:hypothetical protein